MDGISIRWRLGLVVNNANRLFTLFGEFMLLSFLGLFSVEDKGFIGVLDYRT